MTATHERQGHAPGAAIVRDEVVRLGPDGQLVGVVSHPAGGRPHTVGGTPAVILLNAGVLHRVGPHRLHVTLARRLAAAGFATLRLDLGGIGDSTASSDATTFRESAVADTRAAMAGLAELLGARRFVVFGVCSGADNALATALADDRVAGIVIVDPAAYASRRGELRAVRDKLASLGGARGAVRWAARVGVRELRARGEAAIARLRRRGPVEEPPAEGREKPPIGVFREQLGRLAARGCGVLAVYSGIHGPRYNAPEQLFEVFPELRGKVDAAYFPGSNHTFTELGVQGELIATVARWIAARFG